MGPEYASQFDMNNQRLLSLSEWEFFLTLLNRTIRRMDQNWNLLSWYDRTIEHIANRRRAHPETAPKLHLNISEFPTECTGTNGTDADEVETAVRLKCGHLIGRKCLEEWVVAVGSTTCPVCRQSICDIAGILPPPLLELYREYETTVEVIKKYQHEIDVLLMQGCRAPNDGRLLRVSEIMARSRQAWREFSDAFDDYATEGEHPGEGDSSEEDSSEEDSARKIPARKIPAGKIPAGKTPTRKTPTRTSRTRKTPIGNDNAEE
jgi:hypothetical protein